MNVIRKSSFICSSILLLLGCSSAIEKNDRIEDKLKKDTLYFLFENNANENKFYSAKEKGIIFNFSDPVESFLFQDTLKSDTLDIKQLHNYKLVSLSQIEEIDKDWEIKNAKILNAFGGEIEGRFYPAEITDKNDRYITYLIQVLVNQEKFVIYPVIWRDQMYVDIECAIGIPPKPPKPSNKETDEEDLDL